MQQGGKVTVLIADDHSLVREGLTSLLRRCPDFVVVGECADGAAAIESIGALNPDIAIVDLSMPKMHGLEVLSAVQAASPRTRVVVLTASAPEHQLKSAERLGACGILHKDVGIEELVDCIRQVAGGTKSFLVTAIERPSNSVPQAARAADGKLSKRERQIVLLASRGLPNKEIARELNLANGTIKMHLHNIYGKLCVPNRASLTAWMFYRNESAA